MQIKPRCSYNFAEMAVGETIRVKITEDDPRAGVRALCAAYAYGRRNGKKFFGKQATTPVRGRVMVIGRAK